MVVALAVTLLAGIRWGIAHQAALARRRIGKPLGEDAIDADRVWRRRHEGVPLTLLLVGDSLAAGLGATRRRDTLGGRLARQLARRTGRPVRLRTVAVVGAESKDLEGQLDTLGDTEPVDVAVIVVGGNDVTHRVSTSRSTVFLAEAITRLHGRGARVVVGTCPDLRALRPVPQPLRSLAARMSRRLAAAQAITAARCGAGVVDLRRAVGPLFLAAPDDMFAIDRFHPSALGYRRMAEAFLPAVVAALRAR